MNQGTVGKITKWTTYGFNSTTKSDVSKLVTRPFFSQMKMMADVLHQVQNDNKKELKLEKADVSPKYNSCAMLVHFTMPSVKKESTMTYHTDINYSGNGDYNVRANSQCANTCTAVYSIGGPRALKWLKRYHIGGTWKLDKDWKDSMSLTSGSIVIINPLDERPTQRDGNPNNS